MWLTSIARNKIAQTVALVLMSGSAFAAEELKFQGNLTWISAYVHLVPDDETRLNPDNAMFSIPENNLVSEIRPNLKLTSNSFQIVARPKVVAEAKRVKTGDDYTYATGKTKSTINEAFLNWNVSNAVTFSYGRQSYQWGAAELTNPSNRIFHETSQSKNILYEVIGKDLARINLTVGKAFSTVIMTEFQENKDEEPFRYGEEFSSTGLIKSELAWNNGTDYLGVVAGGREGSRGWVGEYFSQQMPFFEGLFIYADASHQRGTSAWYPVMSNVDTPAGPQSIVEFQQTQVEVDKIYSMTVGGIRYDFENGSIIRVEYLKNDAGYTEEERKLFFNSLATQSAAQGAVTERNIVTFNRNGLEFPGQKYWYASVHIPDFLTIQDMTMFLRMLQSVTDNSANAYLSFDYLIGDAGTLSLSASGDAGEKESELRSLVKNSYAAAYKHSW